MYFSNMRSKPQPCTLPASLLHPSNTVFEDALEHLQDGEGCTLCSHTCLLF